MKSDKKKYFELDEIGVIGTQEKRSAAKRKYDYDRTADIIRREKATKSLSLSSAKKAS